MLMNKKGEVYSTMTLNRDRIQRMFDHRFSAKSASGYEYSMSPSDAKFLGKDTLLILFSKYYSRTQKIAQKIGLIKYQAGNGKVLFKNVASLPAEKHLDSLNPCPKDRYLCSYSLIQNKKQSDHWVEVYEVTPRLDAIKLVARCRAVNLKTDDFKSARIVDYIGKDQRYGLIFGTFTAKKKKSSNFFIYLFDTVEKKVSTLIENGKFQGKGLDLSGSTRICQNKMFILTKNFEFLKFEFTGGDQ